MVTEYAINKKTLHKSLSMPIFSYTDRFLNLLQGYQLVYQLSLWNSSENKNIDQNIQRVIIKYNTHDFLSNLFFWKYMFCYFLVGDIGGDP